MPKYLALHHGSSLFDLYGNSGFDIGVRARAGGWRQGRATQGMDGVWEPVNEVIKLRVNGEGTAGKTMPSRIHALDLLLRRANEYTNRSHAGIDRLWLVSQMQHETGAKRRSLVLNGTTRLNTGTLSKIADSDTMLDMDLVLTRHPFWEDRTYIQHYYRTLLASVGGMASMSTRVEGDAPARISFLRVRLQDAQTTPTTEAWIGFRSNALGNPDNFQPNWDCGDSDNDFGDGVSRVTGQSYAHNGQIARWTPGDSNLEDRITVKMGNITSNLSDQNGTFLVLLRAKVSTGATSKFRVRMLSGYYDEAPGGASETKWKVGSRVAIPAHGTGDWFYYPMGIVNIPGDRVLVFKPLLQHFALRLEAEEYSAGSGTLDMDTFTLIPVTEGAIHLSDMYLRSWFGAVHEVNVTTEPDDETVAYTISSTSTYGHRSCPIDLYHWGLPTGYKVNIIGACQQEQESVYANTFVTDFNFYQRWISMRNYY